jgi:hypothetical protein
VCYELIFRATPVTLADVHTTNGEHRLFGCT